MGTSPMPKSRSVNPHLSNSFATEIPSPFAVRPIDFSGHIGVSRYPVITPESQPCKSASTVEARATNSASMGYLAHNPE